MEKQEQQQREKIYSSEEKGFLSTEGKRFFSTERIVMAVLLLAFMIVRHGVDDLSKQINGSTSAMQCLKDDQYWSNTNETEKEYKLKTNESVTKDSLDVLCR